MADNEEDSGQANGTTLAKGSSAGNGDSGSSFDASKLQATLESLTRKLEEVDSRSKALQGDKDRGVNKTNEEVKELKRKLAEIEKLKKSGLDEDGAIEEHSFREDIRAVKDQLARLNPAPAVASGAVDVAKVIADYNLDPKDADVMAELTSRSFKTELELKAAILDYQKGKASLPTPSDADKASRPSAPLSSANTEMLQGEYLKELNAARGQGYAVGNAIKEKYRKKGVPVDELLLKF